MFAGNLLTAWYKIRVGVTKIHSCTPLACAECDVSLPFSGASSIPLCYVLFPATLLHQLFFHRLSHHLGLPLNLVVPKLSYYTPLGILFPSILCTCPNQDNLFNLVSIIVGYFQHLHEFLYWLISSSSDTGIKYILRAKWPCFLKKNLLLLHHFSPFMPPFHMQFHTLCSIHRPDCG